MLKVSKLDLRFFTQELQNIGLRRASLKKYFELILSSPCHDPWKTMRSLPWTLKNHGTLGTILHGHGCLAMIMARSWQDHGKRYLRFSMDHGKAAMCSNAGNTTTRSKVSFLQTFVSSKINFRSRYFENQSKFNAIKANLFQGPIILQILFPCESLI